MNRRIASRKPRRGATLVLMALMMVALLGMLAFATDIGYIMLVRTQLQVAADSAAMAAGSVMGGEKKEIIATARRYAEGNIAGGTNVALANADVEFGTWDANRREFTPTGEVGNAVRVTCRRDATNANGECPLFFARVFGNESFSMEAEAVAMANPRDIAFVVDLSGSMNDDTEPGWATDTINKEFSGHGNVGNQLSQQFYDDFSFGAFPGKLEYIGDPLGAPHNKWAYAEMTKNGGPLSGRSISGRYRINDGDSEAVRKQKAYSWMIDHQIARVMPAAVPAADSSQHYDYWEKYLDYILLSVKIVPPKPPKGGGGGGGGGGGSSGGGGGGGGGGGSSGPKPPPIGKLQPPGNSVEWLTLWREPFGKNVVLDEHQPVAFASSTTATLGLTINRFGLLASQGSPPENRGTIPPSQDGDRINKFNNPNKATFPKAKNANKYRNWIGYFTYVQFMLDHGRDLRPVGREYVPLSINSRDCPYHGEETAGGTFDFPPREQPTHAARRALIAGIEVVRDRNSSLPDPSQGDQVSVISFDTLSGAGPVVEQPLTTDFKQAMQACTKLQAVGDKGATTATEAGLELARQHLASKRQGGKGREFTNKIVVLLTDGVPNLYASSNSEINGYIAQHPSSDFYNNGAYWYDGALMQVSIMDEQRWDIYPVGVGLGTDYDFMDRMARMGNTATGAGQSARGSGNPAEYEQRLTEIFEEIITNPRARLVQ